MKVKGRDCRRSRWGGGGAGGACSRVSGRWAGQWRGARPAVAPERSGGEGAARRGRSGGGAMDRVSSSMKQVSNPLPKVLSRRAGGGGLEAERESFERAQVRGGAVGRCRPGR